jgi:RimJ/RimL family protein N-acetyltransferase
MIELRPFTKEDFPRLISWLSSPRLLLQWAGPQLFHYPLDEHQLEKYISDANKEKPASLIFKVVFEQKQQVIGHIELVGINNERGTASICRVFVDPSWRGRGACQGMVRKILKIGFDDYDLHRIELRVYDFNLEAISCYQKVGFLREGLLREAQREGDQYWNVVLMGILKKEWQMSCGNI